MHGKGTKQNDKSNMTAEQFREREIENAPKGEPMTRDLSGVEYLRQLRGVKTFEEMPLYVQRVYLDVARCFPGVQVWAVGSRVRGDYICMEDSLLQSIFIVSARERAGMKFKIESDFDFLVANDAMQVGKLPRNTDRVRVRVPNGEMVAIPIWEKT